MGGATFLIQLIRKKTAIRRGRKIRLLESSVIYLPDDRSAGYSGFPGGAALLSSGSLLISTHRPHP